MDKKIYYSDDPIVEAEMIEEFGVPDEEYENAMQDEAFWYFISKYNSRKSS